MTTTKIKSTCLLVLAVFFGSSPADARVVRIEIQQRETLQGEYQKLTGRAFGELHPGNSLNAIINDLALAPRNARGNVEYAATFTLILPGDPSRLSGVLLYEVPNRGNSPLNFRLDTDALTAGHVLLSSGWQGDVEFRQDLETITVPVAHNADGSSITGPVLARLSDLTAGANTASLASGYGALRYQRPATLDTGRALLTKQASDDGQIIPIPSTDWAFADCTTKPFPGEPDPTKLCLKGGFDPGLLYQVVYAAKDPLVLGVGLAATRDIVSFFRYADNDDAGNANPLGRRIRYAVAFGTSQSGNFIKTFLNLGFNEDEAKRIVWDGADSNIAGRQTPINFRFAIPGGAVNLYEPGSEGVLWWSDYRDEARQRPAAGLLDRCRATHTCPKIMETFGSTEFWGLRMSPDLVGTRADRDIPLPPEVRRYYFPGVTHGGGRGGFETKPQPAGPCGLAANPNSTAESMRALERALIDWVTKDTLPPASQYPRLDHGDLVLPQHAAMGFPEIPGASLPDNMINPFFDYDFGPDFHYNDMSGTISLQPPSIRGVIPMLVPRTDADGNETSGIPSALHQAPLGTYLGWNVAASGYRKGRACGFIGGFIPFARTKAERLASGDPRPSLEERYGTHAGYVAKVKEAARRLVEQRFLLEDDADRLVREAEASDVLR
jgi:hypothetical protein